MIKVENLKTFNWEGALRGMRNPMNSWDKKDSFECPDGGCYFEQCPEWDDEVGGCDCSPGDFIVGENDMKLMKKLCKGGSEHRKYLRQIFISFDLTSNHFFWQEFDTYKVGVTRNSCSKMHKIHVKSFQRDDFSHEGIDQVGGMAEQHFLQTLDTLEWLRQEFNQRQERKYWRAMLELLPMGYNIKATITMDYENALNMIFQRRKHKVFEWRDLCCILMALPYMRVLVEHMDSLIKEDSENE